VPSPTGSCRHDRGPAKQSVRARGSVKENPRTPARVETPGISAHLPPRPLCLRSPIQGLHRRATRTPSHRPRIRRPLPGLFAGSTMRPAAPSKPPQSAEHSFPQCFFGVPFTTGSCRYRRRSRTTPGRRTVPGADVRSRLVRHAGSAAKRVTTPCSLPPRDAEGEAGGSLSPSHHPTTPSDSRPDRPGVSTVRVGQLRLGRPNSCLPSPSAL
jgi:hypothetical protein